MPYDLPEFSLSASTLSLLFPNGLASGGGEVMAPWLATGLSPEAVAASLAQHGHNILSPPPGIPAWRRFLGHLTSPLQILMIIATVLSWISFGLTGDYHNAVREWGVVVIAVGCVTLHRAHLLAPSPPPSPVAGVLIVAIMVTAVLAQRQENASSDVADALKSLLPATARVRRSGEENDIPLAAVAVGDLCHLRAGMRCPADIILLTGSVDLDLASLTGESAPVGHTPIARSTLLFEARRVCFSGSLVVVGDAWGIALRVGDKTFIGVTTQSVGERMGESELDVEMRRIGIVVAVFAFTIGSALLAIGLGRGLGLVYSIVNAFILVLVASVPEGLPATVTQVLNIASSTLAKRNVLVKRPALLATAAAASVICSDKTGTLTVGRMTVSALWVNRAIVSHNVAEELATRDNSLRAMTTGRALTVLPTGEAIIHSTTRHAHSGAHIITRAHTGAWLPPGGEQFAAHAHVVRQRSMGSMGTAADIVDSQPVGITPSTMPSGLSVPPRIARTCSTSAGWTRSTASPDHHHHHLPVSPHMQRASSMPAVHVPLGGGGSCATTAPTLPLPLHVPLHEGAVLAASWDHANTFTKLLTISIVANSARFAPEPPPTEAPSDAVVTLPTEAPLIIGDPRGVWARVGPHAVLAAPPTHVLMADTRVPTRLGTELARRDVLGDATETALLRFCDAIVPEALWRGAYTIASVIPFDNISKTSAAVISIDAFYDINEEIISGSEGGVTGSDDTGVPSEQITAMGASPSPPPHNPCPPRRYVKLLKGAPERVIALCTATLVDDGIGTALAPLDEPFFAEFQATYTRFGLQGERVLGFACVDCNAEGGAEGPFAFVGLIAMSDPPKAGAREAVDACRLAGIRVTVVTGDHPLTAEAISRQVGIIKALTAREVAASVGVSEDSIDALRDARVGAIILPGAALDDMCDAEWDLALSRPEVVFARTTPAQKASIVARYQALGHVVCCTGDGVNDAPALKRADVGVSMGSQRASDVAREAADIVILDDDWAHVVDLVSEGRRAYANIRKVIAYTLSHAVPELIPVCLAFIFDLPLMVSVGYNQAQREMKRQGSLPPPPPHHSSLELLSSSWI